MRLGSTMRDRFVRLDPSVLALPLQNLTRYGAIADSVARHVVVLPAVESLLGHLPHPRRCGAPAPVHAPITAAAPTVAAPTATPALSLALALAVAHALATAPTAALAITRGASAPASDFRCDLVGLLGQLRVLHDLLQSDLCGALLSLLLVQAHVSCPNAVLPLARQAGELHGSLVAARHGHALVQGLPLLQEALGNLHAHGV
mmetsp:Transcript_25329/g.69659  ORF Transcript_25329/g.69659 Transcript_25329/m.69659 type:complete len:203 (+) Transcript_25329:283-891(+)